ncbi:hypothetical protein Y032_0491g2403 [Ancylostoma ceylanicum]|uniref:Uncharacterized protein n=1 Tax=Ancylostoma ceylanicum TaxID=53326 RepID=A0A016WWZ2_9BILA|nr:hypothetical protein Y032_0491g2403 [Ancylostoma ceylanicum]
MLSCRALTYNLSSMSVILVKIMKDCEDKVAVARSLTAAAKRTRSSAKNVVFQGGSRAYHCGRFNPHRTRRGRYTTAGHNPVRKWSFIIRTGCPRAQECIRLIGVCRNFGTQITMAWSARCDEIRDGYIVFGREAHYTKVNMQKRPPRSFRSDPKTLGHEAKDCEYAVAKRLKKEKAWGSGRKDLPYGHTSWLKVAQTGQKTAAIVLEDCSTLRRRCATVRPVRIDCGRALWRPPSPTFAVDDCEADVHGLRASPTSTAAGDGDVGCYTPRGVWRLSERKTR